MSSQGLWRSIEDYVCGCQGMGVEDAKEVMEGRDHGSGNEEGHLIVLKMQEGKSRLPVEGLQMFLDQLREDQQLYALEMILIDSLGLILVTDDHQWLQVH